ncbi:hypothetical protein BE17_38265, partial [Sorangium cellulosum]
MSMSSCSRALPPALAALGVAALLSLPREAHADEKVAVSGGLSMSLSFGQKVAFGLGVDLRATALFESSSGSPASKGLGPFAQATLLNFEAGRFAIGVHGGSEIVRDYDDVVCTVDGELGWTYRSRYSDELPGQHGLHVGVVSTLFSPVGLDLFARTAIPLSSEPFVPEGTLGMGLRFLPPFGEQTRAIDGRPLRTAEGVVLPP